MKREHQPSGYLVYHQPTNPERTCSLAAAPPTSRMEPKDQTMKAKHPASAKPKTAKPVAGKPTASSGEGGPLRGVEWRGSIVDGVLVVVDQSNLVELHDLEGLQKAIVAKVVGGAPAIGIAAAYGVVLALHPIANAEPHGRPSAELGKPLHEVIAKLTACRPNEPNLRWALDRMLACFQRHVGQLTALELCARLLMEARRIHRDGLDQVAKPAEPKV